MALRDPLLTELKGILLNLKDEQQAIRDGNPKVKQLCENLENILRKGLKQPGSLFGLNKRDFWCWVEALPNYTWNDKINPLFSLAIETCKNSPKLKTHQGRGRCFLRIALVKKIVSVPIEQLLKNPKLTEYWYDPATSIIGNELLKESLMSMLFLITNINFELNLKNASFLDESWQIPVYKHYELVPCKDLGVIVRHVKGRVMVADVKPGSVAGEDEKIEPGDVLDELFGDSLYDCSRGKISQLLYQHEGWPIYVSVIKCHLKNGKIFSPLYVRLGILRKEFKNFKEPQERDPKPRIPPHAQLPRDELDEVPISSPEGSAGYRVKYIDKIAVGQDGGVNQIEGAIMSVIKKHEKNPQDVYFEMGEKDVLVTNIRSRETAFTHSYTEISSCGRRTDTLTYFAYIAGETTCTLSKEFVCYVFEAKTEEESKTILCSIAQGFGRTTWFV
ncbi:uncharacterized protein [Ptychodera flava]|uniref:uncharacterized protein n=1 Tax=Ptychodera flava TaxID=63121 RepID=UPI003969DCB1